MRSAGRQVGLFDGVFLNPRNGHVEKYRDGALVTHFKGGINSRLAKQFGMDGPPDSYPPLPPHLIGSDRFELETKP